MESQHPRHVAATRRRDLLQSLVLWCVAITPAWLLPTPLAVPWLVVVGSLGIPAVVWSWRHAPWVPTPPDDVPRIVRALALEPHQRFCDLGAGDGRLVLAVHRATGAWCTGIEASPLVYLFGRVRLARAGGARARLVFGDLYRADLSAFDAVYVWGTAYSVGTEGFGAFLARALQPGARVVSYHQEVPGLREVARDEGGTRPVFTYVIDDPAS